MKFSGNSIGRHTFYRADTMENQEKPSYFQMCSSKKIFISFLLLLLLPLENISLSLHGT
jgi:hypothetical protein